MCRLLLGGHDWLISLVGRGVRHLATYSLYAQLHTVYMGS
jgi:hypothetical protein